MTNYRYKISQMHASSDKYGIPFTYRSWICRGRCKMCRDYNKEPRTIRRRLKARFRYELPDELES